jgi:hypothetical protein
VRRKVGRAAVRPAALTAPQTSRLSSAGGAACALPRRCKRWRDPFTSSGAGASCARAAPGRRPPSSQSAA